jgi:hypothetical protein
MAKITYDITLDAPTREEVIAKMKAIVVLAARLKTKELEKLAYIVEEDPDTFAMAKSALGL